MLPELPAVAITVSAASFVVAALALALNAFNTLQQRRSNEVKLLLELWERYENYVEAVDTATTSADRTRVRRAYLDAANFIENICTIFNRRSATKLIHENVRGIATDYIAMNDRLFASAGFTYYSFIKREGLSSEAYAETRKFIDNNRAILQRKTLNIIDAPEAPAQAAS